MQRFNDRVESAPDGPPLAELTCEARRLGRRRLIAESVAARSRRGERGLWGDSGEVIALRAASRASRLHVRFLRVIETMWLFGHHREARSLLHAHRRERTDWQRGGRINPDGLTKSEASASLSSNQHCATRRFPCAPIAQNTEDAGPPEGTAEEQKAEATPGRTRPSQAELDSP